jgi:hypothetical protein
MVVKKNSQEMAVKIRLARLGCKKGHFTELLLLIARLQEMANTFKLLVSTTP